jgi:hypothetical protein
MPKKAKIEIHAADDELSAIDDELDAAVDNLVGVNQRIGDLLDTIDPPEPEESPEGETQGTTDGVALEGEGQAAPSGQAADKAEQATASEAASKESKSESA